MDAIFLIKDEEYLVYGAEWHSDLHGYVSANYYLINSNRHSEEHYRYPYTKPALFRDEEAIDRLM